MIQWFLAFSLSGQLSYEVHKIQIAFSPGLPAIKSSGCIFSHFAVWAMSSLIA